MLQIDTQRTTTSHPKWANPEMGETPREQRETATTKIEHRRKYFYNIFYGRWFDGILCVAVKAFHLNRVTKLSYENHQKDCSERALCFSFAAQFRSNSLMQNSLLNVITILAI